MRVDKLEPPNDPLRASFVNHTPLHATPSTGAGLVWDTSNSNDAPVVPNSSGSATGFDMDSISQFDTQVGIHTYCAIFYIVSDPPDIVTVPMLLRVLHGNKPLMVINPKPQRGGIKYGKIVRHNVVMCCMTL